MSDLQRNLLKSKLPSLPNQLSNPTQSRFAGLVPKRKAKNYEPISWNEYFEHCKDIKVKDNSFRFYTSGSSGPILLLLHGGGHSALSWALFVKSITKMCECQAVAVDFRGHGNTVTTDDTDMSADTLASDIANALKVYMEDLPPVVMLGHSMGGAIAVHIGVQGLIPTLKGLAVIDVVEGTALDALSSMGSFIRSRPQAFTSLEHAIEWSIRSGQLKNLESAKVSMPGQLKRISKSIDTKDEVESDPVVNENILEEDETPLPTQGSSTTSKGEYYTWRVDLTKTEPFWKGWFENMSSLFLSCPVPKLLLLAGIDRLDKTLTIGQMQGKFQMQVLGNVGHMVHEDKPDSVAEIILGFLTRQQLTQPKQGVKRHMPAC